MKVPNTPYRNRTGRKPGDLVVTTYDMGQLPLHRLRIRDLALDEGKLVQLPADAKEGSIPSLTPDDVREGLNYWVADGCTKIGAILNEWGAVRLQPHLEQLLGLKLVPSSPRQFANVNVVTDGARGYEWHYDDTAITAVLYLFDHAPGSGDFMWFNEKGVICTAPITSGMLVVGDFSQTPHAVKAVTDQPLRLSLAFGFEVEGNELTDAEREATESFIYGDKSE